MINKLNIIPRMEGVEWFESDLELLNRLKPNNVLNKRFKNANEFNKRDFDGRILDSLLDLIEECDIVKNRNKTAPQKTEVVPAPLTREQKKSRTPQEIFPKIDWSNTDDELIQLCIILFSDAVRQYREMERINKLLDKDPTLAADMVKADERNKMAWKELETFELTKDFNWRHPILAKQKQLRELVNLKKTKPAEFSKKLVNADKNITRYSSMKKNAKKPEDVKKYNDLLEEHKEMKNLIDSILNA